MSRPQIDANHICVIHSNHTNNSTAFVDSAGSTPISTSTGVTHSTAQAKFGASSIEFGNSKKQLLIGNSSGILSIPTFTFECWVYPLNFINTVTLINQTTFNSTGDISILINGANGKLRCQYYYGYSGTSNVVYENPSPTDGFLQLNQWSHIALQRNSSGNFRLFLNGLQQTEWVANSYLVAAKQLRIGNSLDTMPSQHQFIGFLDEIAISNIARYTASGFTPNSYPYATNWRNISGVVNDENNVGIAGYAVAVHRRDNFGFLKSVTTGANGEYSIDLSDFDNPSTYYTGACTVTAYPTETTRNALIFDRVMPVIP